MQKLISECASSSLSLLDTDVHIKVDPGPESPNFWRNCHFIYKLISLTTMSWGTTEQLSKIFRKKLDVVSEFNCSTNSNHDNPEDFRYGFETLVQKQSDVEKDMLCWTIILTFALTNTIWLNCYCWVKLSMMEGRFSKWF